MDQTQTPRYLSRFELLLYVPAFTQKDFHYIVHRGLFTQGTSTEDLGKYNRSTQLLSPTNTTSTIEVRHNNNHLSLEGWALSQTIINLSIVKVHLEGGE